MHVKTSQRHGKLHPALLDGIRKPLTFFRVTTLLGFCGNTEARRDERSEGPKTTVKWFGKSQTDRQTDGQVTDNEG